MLIIFPFQLTVYIGMPYDKWSNEFQEQIWNKSFKLELYGFKILPGWQAFFKYFISATIYQFLEQRVPSSIKAASCLKEEIFYLW